MNPQTSFLTLAVTLLLCCAAQAHTFTLADGSKVEAQITAIANGQLTLQTADKRVLNLPVAGLQPQDQAHARQWWDENRPFWFAISATAQLHPDTGGNKKETTETRRWTYNVSVRNNSGQPTPEITADYAVFKSGPGQKVPASATTGTVRIPALAPGAAHTFETTAVDISVYKAPQGSFFVRGNKQQHKDQLEGVTVKLQRGSKNIWLHESTAGLLSSRGSLGSGGAVLIIQGNPSGRPFSGPPDKWNPSLSGGNAKVFFSSPGR